MAVRIRKNGRIFCAAMHPAEPDDIYIDDSFHYILSVEKKILRTEPWEKHKINGEWWWAGLEPTNVEIEDFYLTDLYCLNPKTVENKENG